MRDTIGFMRTTIDADRRIDVFEFGHGEAIVALHCTGGNAGQWKRVADHLDGKFRTVAPNFIGVGRTEQLGDDSQHWLEADISVVLAILEKQHRPVHLMGHSYGGHVALNVALNMKDSLKSLILVEPAVPGGNSAGRFSINTTSMQSTVSDLVEFFDRTGAHGGWSSIPESRRAKLIADRFTLAAQINAIVESELPEIGEIAGRLPCAIISGADTSPEIHQHCNDLSRMIESAQRFVVPDAGHMLPITHAKEVAEITLAHLEKTPPVPAA